MVRTSTTAIGGVVREEMNNHEGTKGEKNETKKDIKCCIQDNNPNSCFHNNSNKNNANNINNYQVDGNHDENSCNNIPLSDEQKKKLENFSNEWIELQQEELSSADYYFNSYAHFAIHEEMLKDSVRTGSYHKAIMRNRHLFKDKIVLDVGSGTGILCLFAAAAGAKHVYGVECSEIVEMSKKISEKNNYKDKITFIKGKAEEIELPVNNVDIILSEWMGYFLLYESMLDTVIYCRDKWLNKETGLLFPDYATLRIAAIEDADYKQEKVGFWENVYEFDYSCVKKCIMEEPIVDTVDANTIVTTPHTILHLDLYKCSVDDLNFCSYFKLNVLRKDFIHAFIAWFDVEFRACHVPVAFSTGPESRYTHWKQTVFYMDTVLVANKNESVDGMIAVKKNGKNPRDLDIKINFSHAGTGGATDRTQFYRLR